MRSSVVPRVGSTLCAVAKGLVWGTLAAVDGLQRIVAETSEQVNDALDATNSGVARRIVKREPTTWARRRPLVRGDQHAVRHVSARAETAHCFAAALHLGPKASAEIRESFPP